ncbi:hypothetical protein [Rhizobacter sp. LjRoot28]|jgi:hypothetical protein|uniref:hypothetical protein n=1 Tax=Rhizobacter sp. LjRoot28 TaxID=3342309 RepID=UPI003ED05F47
MNDPHRSVVLFLCTVGAIGLIVGVSYALYLNFKDRRKRLARREARRNARAAERSKGKRRE